MRTLFLFFLALCIACPVFSASSKPDKIRIGFIPSEPDKRLRKNAKELARHLQKKIGVAVEIYIPKSYQGLIEKMKKNEIDFGFFTAMSFVYAEKQAGAKVLLKKVWSENPFYHSVIVARKGRGIENLKDLKGKVFAFVDKKSTSGFLYPNVKFKSEKINPNRFFSKIIYSGNHQAAISDVLTGRADAAAVFADDEKGNKTAWSHYYPNRKGLQKILWLSEPIPNDPFCVSDSFYSKYPMVTHELMFALLDLKNEKVGNLLKSLLGVEKLDFATSRHYEPVRRMVKSLNLKLDES